MIVVVHKLYYKIKIVGLYGRPRILKVYQTFILMIVTECFGFKYHLQKYFAFSPSPIIKGVIAILISRPNTFFCKLQCSTYDSK